MNSLRIALIRCTKVSQNGIDRDIFNVHRNTDIYIVLETVFKDV